MKFNSDFHFADSLPEDERKINSNNMNTLNMNGCAGEKTVFGRLPSCTRHVCRAAYQCTLRVCEILWVKEAVKL